VRSIVFLGLAAIAAGAVIVRELPEHQAEADARPVQPQEIQSVQFEGRGLPLATLRAAVTTHVGDQVDDIKLERDRTSLQTTLIAQGYLAAEVEHPTITFDGGGAFVAYAIRTGALYHVRDVKVTTVAKDVNIKDAGIVTLTKGDEAVAATIERARQHIIDVLASKSHKHSVDVKLHTDPGAGVVDVELAIK
jgi:outer membrane protein assembly factor BamA